VGALAPQGSSCGGGDNPYFIQEMHDWIVGNQIPLHVYFDSTDTSDNGAEIYPTTNYPNAAALFKQLF
jgi:hypothetical protein